MDQEFLQSKYWDKEAKRIGKVNKEISLLAIKEINDFFDFIGFKQNSNILEVGCGAGRFTFPLLRKGHKVTGTEVSGRSLEELQYMAKEENLVKNLTLIKTNFEKPVFENEFDVVIIGNVIHHFNPQQMQNIIINIVKALKPGGKIAVFEPNAYYPLYLPLYLFLELSGREKGVWEVEKGLFKNTPRRLKKMLKNSHIDNITLKRHTLIPLRLGNIIKSVDKINEFLLQIPIVRSFSVYIWLKGEKKY